MLNGQAASKLVAEWLTAKVEGALGELVARLFWMTQVLVISYIKGSSAYRRLWIALTGWFVSRRNHDYQASGCK